MPSADFDTKNPQATVAEARAAGYSHVFAKCSNCEQSACLPFNLIRRLPASACLDDIATRLRCDRCGAAAYHGTVVYWRVGDATRGR